MTTVLSYRVSSRRVDILLILGFMSLTGALVVAYFAPARGYEPSIYSATPMEFWIGLGFALVASLVVAFNAKGHQQRWLGLLLGGTGTFTFASLPVIRSYHFYGPHDPLIHLGWVRAVAVGLWDPLGLLYPGSHLMSVLVASTGGFSFRRAMMLLVLVFTVVYIVFIPLSVRELFSDELSIVVATFSGFLLLPINNVSTLFQYFPFSFAVLFLPLAFYLLIKHVLSGSDGFGLTSASGFALLSAGTAVLIFHPMAMLDFLVFLGVIGAFQLYRQYVRPKRLRERTGTVYAHVVILGALFVWWTSGHWQLYTTIEMTQAALANVMSGSSAAGQSVQSQAASASAIGVSVVELFGKLFLLSSIYVVLATVFVVGRVRSRVDRDSMHQAHVITYFFWGGIALIPLATLNFLGKVSTYFFRHLGFGMMVATMLGAIGIRYYGERLDELVPSFRLRPFLTAFFALALVLQLAILFPSPYIHLPNLQVTESQMEGYETAFQNQPTDRAVYFTGIRTTTNRYEVALIDAPYSAWSGPIPADALTDDPRSYFRTHPEEVLRRDHYLVVTDYDRHREVGAYRELRYTRESLSAIDAKHGVHRIYTNGEFTLYYIDVVSDGTASEAA